MKLIRTSEVKFVNDNIEKEFYKLDKNDEIRKYIARAIKDIQINAFCGVQIPKRLIL